MNEKKNPIGGRLLLGKIYIVQSDATRGRLKTTKKSNSISDDVIFVVAVSVAAVLHEYMIIVIIILS